MHSPSAIVVRGASVSALHQLLSVSGQLLWKRKLIITGREAAVLFKQGRCFLFRVWWTEWPEGEF